METDWDEKPWWRNVGLEGWLLLLLALFATCAFILGVITGETLFLPTFRAKSGPMDASMHEHPIWFALVMTLNAIIAVGIWFLFGRWLKTRPSALRKPPVPTRSQSRD
jgi:hypothetical protein